MPILTRDNRISRKHIEVLKSFDNQNINNHFIAVEESFRRAREELGEPFISAVEKYSLNPYETMLVHYYANFIASELNRSLRRRDNDKVFLLYKDLLNKCLNMIEPYNNGQLNVAFRFNDELEYYNWYEKNINKIIEFPNFLGSSKDKWLNKGCYPQIKTNSIA